MVLGVNTGQDTSDDVVLRIQNYSNDDGEDGDVTGDGLTNISCDVQTAVTTGQDGES